MEDRFENFVRSINSIHRSINKIKSIEMSEFGLKGNHTLCIYYLAKKQDGLNATQLAEICEEDKAAVSRTLNYLEDQGYVKWQGDQKYRAVYMLTSKGIDISEKINQIIEDILSHVGNFMSEKKRQEFYETLDQLDKQLEVYSK